MSVLGMSSDLGHELLCRICGLFVAAIHADIDALEFLCQINHLYMIKSQISFHSVHYPYAGELIVCKCPLRQ